MPLPSRKRNSTGRRSTRGPSINEVLRTAYQRFTRDEHTRRALNIFVPRPSTESVGATAMRLRKPACKQEESPSFSGRDLAPLPA